MPITFLDWRRSHHQAIGPIRDRVIPTGSRRRILKEVAIYLDTHFEAPATTSLGPPSRPVPCSPSWPRHLSV
jgi:hypothetical protein